MAIIDCHSHLFHLVLGSVKKMSCSDMKECDSGGIVCRTRSRRECVDSPLEQVDDDDEDDNVSVYTTVRQCLVFF